MRALKTTEDRGRVVQLRAVRKHQSHRTTSAAKLTGKQQLFATEYLRDFNGTQAAIRAGYSARTAKEQAHRLLNTPQVKQAVDAAREKVVERVEITVEKVLSDLEQARTKSIDAKQFSSAVRASELQGKYLKMFFDGHTVDPTGIAAKSKQELVDELVRIVGPDALANALATGSLESLPTSGGASEKTEG